MAENVEQTQGALGAPVSDRTRLTRSGRGGRVALPIGLIVIAILVPLVIGDAFTIGILTDSLVYVTLALSYDLSVGRVGALSLAHPAFFGTGAYAAAIVAQRLSLPLSLQVLIAIGSAIVLAVVIGIPAFRLSQLTFGMATLGFALIAELVAENQIGLTNGPLCLSNLKTLHSGMLASLGATVGEQQYYIFLLIAVCVAGLFWSLVRSRVGRAYTAVRDDEPMAMAAGLNPTGYRMSAFVIGAGVAGLLGAFYAHYLTVVCPTNLDISYTVNLLVILFLGGTGGFWGIIAAAFVFTAIPEALQVAPNIRLIVYGAALLAGVMLFPEGFEGLAKDLRRRIRRHKGADNA
ncbi:MAG TPA: branched-chain amino acid ABC transporter permease [Solirubrobacteraceae bacterium]|jgi:ABC-type branched-subunit amino acid transport system permease subunit|nr:branched-chain amino acid ABC transporter permease [Solirubrobacteraceae bacterium]